MLRTTLILACALGSTLFSSARALAQTDTAAAQAVFDDAKKLMAKGDYANACPKLAASYKLDPQPGTEFNLADCLEHQGKTASAWSHFVSVADTLNLQHDTARSNASRTRATALEAKLMRLTINVPDAAKVDGLKVTRDSEDVSSALWGTSVPVDPGDHVVAATAPNKKSWQQAVTMSKEGSTTAVDVPALESSTPQPVATPTPTPEQPPVQPPQPQPSSGGGLGGQKMVALVAGGVGVVGIILGSIEGAAASSDWSNSQSGCATPTNCTNHAQAVQDHDSANSEALISTVSFVAGGALLATGVVLWLTAPKPKTSGVGMTVAPTLQPRSAGLSLQGVF